MVLGLFYATVAVVLACKLLGAGANAKKLMPMALGLLFTVTVLRSLLFSARATIARWNGETSSSSMLAALIAAAFVVVLVHHITRNRPALKLGPKSKGGKKK